MAAALYQSLIERKSDQLQQITDTHESAHDRCYAVISLLFRIAEEEPEAMVFMLYTRHREFLPEELPVCSSRPFEIMRSMVEYGMQRGEIEQRDVLVASTCLFGGAIRMITSYLDGVIEKPLGDYLEDIWTCSWRAVART